VNAAVQTITTIYADPTGQSHFGKMDINLNDGGPIGLLSQQFPARGLKFRLTEEDYDYDWHPAPARQFVIIRKGQVDFTVSNGETRRFGPGDVVLLEDTEGKGHKSKAVDGPRESIFVILE
jgi:hypothetical protein